MLSSCVGLVFALLRCVDDFLESRFLFVGLCFLVFVDCVRVLESVELDSESNSKTLNLGSTPLGLCLCSLFRISLDSVITLESVGLDSVNVLDSVLPRFSALDSESALDSVDSKFLRVVLILSFLESCSHEYFLDSQNRFVFSQKGVLSPPRSP